MQKSLGFTLIELLVVVLIIGILAAVALPQYEKAVEKSRAAQAFALAKSIHEAQEAFKMASGDYTRSFEDLDIDIPTVAGQPNTCGLAANEIRYTKDFAIALGTNGQYTGDVIVARNWGKDQCYGIGYIQGALHCSEYPGCIKRIFASKRLAARWILPPPTGTTINFLNWAADLKSPGRKPGEFHWLAKRLFLFKLCGFGGF